MTLHSCIVRMLTMLFTRSAAKSSTVVFINNNIISINELDSAIVIKSCLLFYINHTLHS